jgi:hypothetical protein
VEVVVVLVVKEVANLVLVRQHEVFLFFAFEFDYSCYINNKI